MLTLKHEIDYMFYFWLYRKFNDGIPCKSEALKAIPCFNKHSEIRLILDLYSQGYSIDVISQDLNLTRERVRQYLIKGARIARTSK